MDKCNQGFVVPELHARPSAWNAIWFVAGLWVMILGACGCCHGGNDKPVESFEAERPFTREDLMRMLQATPELCSKLSSYNELLGEEDSVEKLKSLDRLAQKYGYSRYSEFAVAYTRITNAATYIRILEKGGNNGIIRVGDGSQKLVGEDAKLILPYVDDVERVVKEARSAKENR